MTCYAPERTRQREVSRHRTSEGLVLWLRCDTCGRLRMLLDPDAPDQPAVIAGAPTPGCSGCL